MDNNKNRSIISMKVLTVANNNMMNGGNNPMY